MDLPGDLPLMKAGLQGLLHRKHHMGLISCHRLNKLVNKKTKKMIEPSQKQPELNLLNSLILSVNLPR